MPVTGIADPLTILARYAAGFFPLYDPDDRFYWERLSVRAVIPVTPASLAAAEKLSRRSRRRFVLRHTHDVPAVIRHLRDESVKPRTWVRAEIVAIYRALHALGLLSTIEACDAHSGRLAGAVLGIILPGTFIAETMFSLVPDASKVCLCRLVQDASAAGQTLIDVQTPHHLNEFGLPRDIADGGTPHPCIRLGEVHVPIAPFLRMFRAAWKTQFPGTVADWLAVAGALTDAARDPAQAAALGQIPEAHRRAAWPLLRGQFPMDIQQRLAGQLASPREPDRP